VACLPASIESRPRPGPTVRRSMMVSLAGRAPARIALLVHVGLILGLMSVLEATMTLPGIAGIVLTIGCLPASIESRPRPGPTVRRSMMVSLAGRAPARSRIAAYGVFGLFANIALLVHVGLILGLMSVLEATMTPAEARADGPALDDGELGRQGAGAQQDREVVGLLHLVVVLMFAAYGVFGLFANIALLVHVGLILGLMSVLEAIESRPRPGPTVRRSMMVSLAGRAPARSRIERSLACPTACSASSPTSRCWSMWA
jgi:hypothetical protein